MFVDLPRLLSTLCKIPGFHKCFVQFYNFFGLYWQLYVHFYELDYFACPLGVFRLNMWTSG